MLYILIVLTIATLGVSVVYFAESEKFRKESAMVAAIVCSMLGAIVIVLPLLFSYSSYLDIKADYYGVITQYKDAIDIYTDKAVINVDKISFTDFKYQGYQEEISSMIKDLRSKVTNYNSIYIKKKTMKKNLIFSWLIVPPDLDMKLLQMTRSKKEK